MIRDVQFKEQFERLIREQGYDRLDALMGIDDYCEEVPLYSRTSQLDFLGSLSVPEKNRSLIRAAVWHLETLLEHSRRYYAGRDHDYHCMVTVLDEEHYETGDLLIPGLWFANPSRGVFEYLRPRPAKSGYADFVAACIDRDPDYQLSETRYEFLPGVDRVYVERADMARYRNRSVHTG